MTAIVSTGWKALSESERAMATHVRIFVTFLLVATGASLLACTAPDASGDAAAPDPGDASAASDGGPRDGGASDAAVPADAVPADAVPADGGAACPDGEGPLIHGVSGERTHEATLRITGCRFGFKDQPGPRLFDTVDNQPAYVGLSTGDPIPVGEGAPWTENAGPWRSTVHLADEAPRAHRSAFYRASGGTHGGDGALGWPRALGGTRPPASQRVLYVSWWYRPSMDPGGGDPVGSNKFIRVWDDPGGTGTRLSWTHMHIDYSGSSHPGWRSWTVDGRVGEWNRLEIIVDADRGTIRHFVNGVYQQVSNSAVGGAFEIDDFVKDPAFEDLGLNIGVIGFDHGQDGYGAMVTDFGEIYVDVTRARVEIGDAPTWTGTRHREIQIPVAWSDGALEVRLQEGAFDGLGGRWLYVIDADGRVNEAGHPL